MATGAAIGIFEIVETLTMSLDFWLHTVGLESGPFTTALPIDPSNGIPIPMLLQPIYFVYGLLLLGLSAWFWLRHRRVIHAVGMSGVLVLLAVALSANVLLGPLGVGLLVWRVSANGLNQTYGADAVSLLLVVPAALAAAWLWRVGHRLAAPLGARGWVGHALLRHRRDARRRLPALSGQQRAVLLAVPGAHHLELDDCGPRLEHSRCGAASACPVAAACLRDARHPGRRTARPDVDRSARCRSR